MPYFQTGISDPALDPDYIPGYLNQGSEILSRQMESIWLRFGRVEVDLRIWHTVHSGSPSYPQHPWGWMSWLKHGQGYVCMICSSSVTCSVLLQVLLSSAFSIWRTGDQERLNLVCPVWFSAAVQSTGAIRAHTTTPFPPKKNWFGTGAGWKLVQSWFNLRTLSEPVCFSTD